MVIHSPLIWVLQVIILIYVCICSTIIQFHVLFLLSDEPEYLELQEVLFEATLPLPEPREQYRLVRSWASFV